jgi:hypothetical protein
VDLNESVEMKERMSCETLSKTMKVRRYWSQVVGRMKREGGSSVVTSLTRSFTRFYHVIPILHPAELVASRSEWTERYYLLALSLVYVFQVEVITCDPCVSIFLFKSGRLLEDLHFLDNPYNLVQASNLVCNYILMS